MRTIEAAANFRPGIETEMINLVMSGILTSLIFSSAVAAAPAADGRQVAARVSAVDLCAALAVVKAGDRLPVSIQGVYWVGPEYQLLYDLETPTCQPGYQPVTWVDFDPTYREPTELTQLIQKNSRARVTFRGMLWGPGRSLPDDPTLPLGKAYMQRTSTLERYGHGSRFRTKIVVSEVVSLDELPESAPGPPRSFEVPRSPFPKVIRGEVPTHYPKRADILDIEGDVVVEINLKAGSVVSAHVISAADRLLIEDTLASIKTWVFERDAEATFTTTFSYRFEDDLPATTASVRVRTELPVKVEIIAPRNNW